MSTQCKTDYVKLVITVLLWPSRLDKGILSFVIDAQ